MNEVLSAGSYGMIIRPNLDCSTGLPSSDYTNIGKIASKEDNQVEYDIITSLPVFHNAPYITKDEISMCTIQNEWLEQYADINMPGIIEVYTSQNDNTQLTMPYLGLDFLEYILHFKNPFKSVNKNLGFHSGSTAIMDVPKLKRLMHGLNLLYESIEIMNNDYGIFHTDIKHNNIMYDPVTNKFKLIDFGSSVSISVKRTIKDKNLMKLYIQDKYQFFEKVVLLLIYTSFNNKYIYQQLLPYVKELERTNLIILNHSNINFLPKERISYEDYKKEAIQLCDHFMEVITEGVNKLDDRIPVVESTGFLPPPPYMTPDNTYVPELYKQRRDYEYSTKGRENKEMGIEDTHAKTLRARETGRGRGRSHRRRKSSVTKKRNRRVRKHTTHRKK